MSCSPKSTLIAAAAAGALALTASQAQAVNYVLDLTGDVSAMTTNAFTFGGRDYNTGFLALSGFTPFTLQDGDTVDVTINITGGPFVVPTAEEMFFGVDFSDIPGGAQPTMAEAHGFESADGEPEVEVGCSNCTSFIRGFASTPFQFTALTLQGSFVLAEPYDINSIAVSYPVSGPARELGGVPEPTTWALMIAGFGGAGAMLRRRRAAVAAA